MHAIFASGGVAYVDGCPCYFDRETSKFIMLKNGITKSFNTLEELACFAAFNGRQLSMRRLDYSRYEWMVLTYDEVHSSFARKKDAIEYCLRYTQDMRSSKTTIKIEPGIYEYTGPRRNNHVHFFVGLRQALLSSGFSEIIGRWDEKMANSE